MWYRIGWCAPLWAFEAGRGVDLLDPRPAAAGCAASSLALAPRVSACQASAADFASVKALTYDGATKAMAAATAEAEANGWVVTIVVADSGGHPILLHRLGAAPMTVDVAMGAAHHCRCR